MPTKATGGAGSPSRASITLDEATKWINGIGFGIYLLAAMGLAVYASFFRQVGLTWTDAKPWIGGFICIGIGLFVLSRIVYWLQNAEIDKKTKSLVAKCLLGCFVVIVMVLTAWLIVFVLKDAGLIAQPASTAAETSKKEWLELNRVRHKNNLEEIKKVAVTDEMQKKAQRLDRIYRDHHDSITQNHFPSAVPLREQYRKELEDFKKLAPNVDLEPMVSLPKSPEEIQKQQSRQG